MKLDRRANAAMLAGRPFSRLVEDSRRVVDETPVGDSLFLIQSLKSFVELRDTEAALLVSRRNNGAL